MFHNTKNIFLFILVAFVAHSCDDTEETAQDGHTDADGMEIVEMIDGEEGLLYSECNGVIDNNFQSGIPSGNEWDLTVHFLDDECEELEHDDDDHDGHDHGDDDHDDHGDDHGDDEAYLEITGYDTSIISITVGGHDDHGDEEHCEDFTTETECGEHDECEWHADDMACEDADHGDHHCEDFTTETECGEHDECEWHADDMACEDAEHGDHDDHDEEHGYTFELETLAPGETTFEVRLMHQGHSDYTSSTITIVVE